MTRWPVHLSHARGMLAAGGARRRFACALFGLALGACAGLVPQVLHERPGMFGTLAVTAEHDGLRALRFGRTGIAQSVVRPGDPGYLHFTYARLVTAGMALAPAARRVLVVGLGAGSVPMFLYQHFPQLQIDVVEIDPAVVAVAREQFDFRTDERMKAYLGDGRAFVENASAGQYDMIVLDAFGSESVPPHLATLEFLAAVRRALTPDGVLASNLWNSRYNRQYRAMLATHRQAFAEVHVIDTLREVNHVVLALPRARGLTAQTLADAARRLGTNHRFGFDLAELVAAGHAQLPVTADGVVLRDAGPAP